MPSCDLCGATKPLCKATIEGCILHVCQPCSLSGTVLERAGAPAKKTQLPTTAVSKESPCFIILGDYARRIKQAREQRAISQEAFAQSLNEKESVIRHLENGSIRPSIQLAHKLERLLSIKLIEGSSLPSDSEGADIAKGHSPPAPQDLTVGDVITIRKKHSA